MRQFKGGEEEYHHKATMDKFTLESTKMDLRVHETERLRRSLNAQMLNDFKVVHSCKQVIQEWEHEYLNTIELQISMYVAGEIY